MEIPSSFIPMDIQQQRIKYVSDRAPIAMFTTEDGRVDLGVNTSSTTWGDSDLAILRDFYRAGIINLYDKTDFSKDTIELINDRKFIVFEFNGTLHPDENSFRNEGSLSKYIYIQYTIYNNNVLLFNFSAPAIQRPKWEATVKEMMTSIKIR